MGRWGWTNENTLGSEPVTKGQSLCGSPADCAVPSVLPLEHAGGTCGVPFCGAVWGPRGAGRMADGAPLRQVEGQKGDGGQL